MLKLWSLSLVDFALCSQLLRVPNSVLICQNCCIFSVTLAENFAHFPLPWSKYLQKFNIQEPNAYKSETLIFAEEQYKNFIQNFDHFGQKQKISTNKNQMNQMHTNQKHKNFYGKTTKNVTKKRGKYFKTIGNWG